jgi:hypothetical protein
MIIKMLIVTAFIFLLQSNTLQGEVQAPEWVHPKASSMITDYQGPFVRISKDSILTVDESNALISGDNGNSWTSYKLFNGNKEYSVRPERAIIKTNEDIVILAFTNNNERNWTWNAKIQDASPGDRLPTYVTRSLNGGKKWEEPKMLHEEWTGAIRDIIQTKSGRVVFTSMMLLHDPGRHSVVTYSSSNSGKTWERSNIIDLGGSGHHGGVSEATITELNDGRLWLLMRTNLDRFWSAFSADGVDWRYILPSNIPSSSAPGIIHRLDSGRLVLFWNQLYPEGKSDYPRSGGDGNWTGYPVTNYRQELSMAFSEDDGKSWSEPIIIARGKDNKKNRIAYPYVFEYKPGILWLTTMQGGLRIQLAEDDFIN